MRVVSMGKIRSLANRCLIRAVAQPSLRDTNVVNVCVTITHGFAYKPGSGGLLNQNVDVRAWLASTLVPVVLTAAAHTGSAGRCPTMEVLHVVTKSESSSRAVRSGAAIIYVEEHPLLNFGDFTSANVSVTEGQIVLNVALTGESAKRLQTFTASHVGDRMAYVVNGRVVKVPKILDPITGTGFLIGPFPPAEGQALADAINGENSDCKSQRR